MTSEFNISKFITGYAPKVQTGKTDNEAIINKLFNNEYPITVTDRRNQEYLDQIMNNIQSIPHIQLPVMELNTDVFKAELIKVEKDDSKDIKKLIHKINRKCACHTCDHTRFEKMKVQYASDIVELRKSKNLKEINQYYESMASCCNWLTDKESGKKIKFEYEDGSKKAINDKYWLQQIQQKAIDFQNEVMRMNVKYLASHCPKCEKLQKEYEYELFEIQQMRDEIQAEREEEIKRVQAEIENPPIIDFMNKYFQDKERVKLGDITKLWKAVNRKMIKQDDLAEMLEETEQWHITNSHNIRYVNVGKKPDENK